MATEAHHPDKKYLLVRNTLVTAAAATVAAALGIATRYEIQTLEPIKGAFFKPPTFENPTKDIATERTLGINRELGKSLTIITLGDSECFKNGTKIGNGTIHDTSFPEIFAHKMRNKGLQMTSIIYATPGDTTDDALTTLHREDVRNTIRTAENPIIVLSLSGNDFRKFIDHPKVHAALERVQAPLTLRRLIGVIGTAHGLSRRHIRTGKMLEDNFITVLDEMDKLAQERQRLGNGSITGLVITLPPDFGFSPTVTFVRPNGSGKEVKNTTFDGNSGKVRNVATLIASTVAKREIRAWKRFAKQRQSHYPVAFMPMWEVLQAIHFSSDQHVGQDGQEVLSSALESAVFSPSES